MERVNVPKLEARITELTDRVRQLEGELNEALAGQNSALDRGYNRMIDGQMIRAVLELPPDAPYEQVLAAATAGRDALKAWEWLDEAGMDVDVGGFAVEETLDPRYGAQGHDPACEVYDDVFEVKGREPIVTPRVWGSRLIYSDREAPDGTLNIRHTRIMPTPFQAVQWGMENLQDVPDEKQETPK